MFGVPDPHLYEMNFIHAIHKHKIAASGSKQCHTVQNTLWDVSLYATEVSEVERLVLAII